MTGAPRYIRDMPLARKADLAQRQARITQAAAIETLRHHAEGRMPHRLHAHCPTVGRYDSRDPLCPVCTALKCLET